MKLNTKKWTAKESEAKKQETVKSKIHNLLIVDESGSMTSIYQTALDGMNETLQSIRDTFRQYPEQKQEVTLVTFDDNHYNEIFRSTPVEKTRDLTKKDYRPCGCTPLFDAVGRAVTTLSKEVKEGEGVLVTIITDGMENASCEYTLQDIKNLIEQFTEKGWLFTYIGANQDAMTVGKTMSINATLNFDANDVGMKEMWIKERRARGKFYTQARETDPLDASKKLNNSNFF